MKYLLVSYFFVWFFSGVYQKTQTHYFEFEPARYMASIEEAMPAPKKCSDMLLMIFRNVVDEHRLKQLNIFEQMEKDPKKEKKILKIFEKFQNKSPWDDHEVKNFISRLYEEYDQVPFVYQTLAMNSERRKLMYNNYVDGMIEKALANQGMMSALDELGFVSDPKTKSLLKKYLTNVYYTLDPIYTSVAATLKISSGALLISLPEINMVDNHKVHKQILNYLLENGINKTKKFIHTKFKNRIYLHLYTRSLIRLNRYTLALSATITLYQYFSKYHDMSAKDHVENIERQIEALKKSIELTFNEIHKIEGGVIPPEESGDGLDFEVNM